MILLLILPGIFKILFSNQKEAGFDNEDIKYWMPVDQYIGGIEHAILHLLYSRFFMQALAHKNDEFDITEPFKGLFTQGMVCHETYKDSNNQWVSPDEIETIDGVKYLKNNKSEKIIVGASESMSKSKKNTIDPEKIISNYGADAVRLFILSDSPPEKDVQWSEEGIESSYKFIQKLWNLHLKIIEESNKNYEKDNDQEIDKFTNKFIKKITHNLENFSYNVIIASIHQMYSFLIKEISKKYKKKTLLNNYEKILITITPVIPHFSNECLENINFKKEFIWPSYDEKLVVDEKIDFVIQINGKKRGVLKVKRDIDETSLLNLIKGNENLKKYVDAKTIKKQIFIKNRLINLIII